MSLASKKVLARGGRAWIGVKDEAPTRFACFEEEERERPEANLIAVADNDVIYPLGPEFPITCLLTPGHTPGSMCYLFGDEQGRACPLASLHI